jgi:hypothetical protein
VLTPISIKRSLGDMAVANARVAVTCVRVAVLSNTMGLKKRPPSDGNLAVMWAFARIGLVANVRQVSLLTTTSVLVYWSSLYFVPNFDQRFN